MNEDQGQAIGPHMFTIMIRTVLEVCFKTTACCLISFFYTFYSQAEICFCFQGSEDGKLHRATMMHN
jgi:hypothetical protein